MSDAPSIEGLPFEIAGIETSDAKLELTYRNEVGNSVTRRVYRQAGDSIHEVDAEWMFNYRTGQWEQVRDFTREHDLAEDGTTLLGDGSGWSGAGRAWKQWFTEWHFKRLNLRYPEQISEPPSSTVQQAATA
jgi:hypothetical protein